MAWLIGGLLIIVLILAAWLAYLRASIRELDWQLVAQSQTTTNRLLTVISRDRALRHFTHTLNQQLADTRLARQRYTAGDNALKQAITNVAHDLRTPLTTINGYLELLEKEPQSAVTQRYLAIIIERTNAMNQLTEALFQYSLAKVNNGALTITTVNLTDAVAAALAAQYAVFRDRQIVPAVQLPEAPVPRALDATAMQTVLANIFQVVVHYQPSRVQVVLTTAGTLTVTFSAAALDMGKVGRLFDQYDSVEMARPAGGLGLATARTLVAQMAGTLTAAYQAGACTITMTFLQ